MLENYVFSSARFVVLLYLLPARRMQDTGNNDIIPANNFARNTYLPSIIRFTDGQLKRIRLHYVQTPPWVSLLRDAGMAWDLRSTTTGFER